MKSNICIDVELLAGTSIEDAIQEAKDKAIKWDIAYVKFSFNGIKMSVSHKADVQTLADKYHTCCETNIKYIVG